MANPHANSLTPITPAHILDPYPEHLASLGGARKTTPTAQPTACQITSPGSRAAPTVFAASLKPGPIRRRRPRYPVTAVGLTSLGQAVLAGAIAVGGIGPVVGVAVALAWLACGLTLIAAWWMASAEAEREAQ